MRLFGGRLEATYEREIERKPLNNILFYGGLAVVIFLAVFIFGIRPTTLALAQNKEYEKELAQIRDAMNTKLIQIQNSEETISRETEGVAALNAAITNDVDLQEFLSQLVLEAANSGYSIERVKETDIVGDVIKVDVELVGDTLQLAQLMRGIENMQRFVTIQDLRLDTKGTFASVDMRAEIYKL